VFLYCQLLIGVNMEILKQSFYERDTKIVAQELLGKILVHKLQEGVVSGKIVETEAYFGEGDPASHASRGKTPRSSFMFGLPGHAYVYFNYGMHWLFNVVTEKEGIPGAVLIRALEPLEGIELMQENRGVYDISRLTDGPAKLTKAMGIGAFCNGRDITRGDLFICTSEKNEKLIIKSSKRIGISSAKDDLLRYYIKKNKFVSNK
ncbi:MAG: DNA-3-methyladenine glycosylase, partial [Candidatus Subteraquimicrobiales bacterium]|nr:DNA-3-methyladenine glycosylase [Candidatus Subteraquimicrobiales bacterium]